MRKPRINEVAKRSSTFGLAMGVFIFIGLGSLLGLELFGIIGSGKTAPAEIWVAVVNIGADIVDGTGNLIRVIGYTAGLVMCFLFLGIGTVCFYYLGLRWKLKRRLRERLDNDETSA